MLKKSFKARLMSLVLIPILIISILLTVVSSIRLTSTMEQETEDKLIASAYALREMLEAQDGDFTVDNDTLFLNGKDASYINDVFDGFTCESGMYATLFIGDTRRATSVKNDGKRAIGTQASSEVANKVLKGENYTSLSTQVVGTECVVAYIPLRDSSNKVVGMVFTGVSKSNMNSQIRKGVFTLIALGIVLTILSIVIAVVVLNTLTKIIISASQSCTEMANGDFRKLNEDLIGVERQDELGTMVKNTIAIRKKLNDVISIVKDNTQTLSNNASILSDNATKSSTTIDELSNAVEDIANGATTQSEEVQNSVENVSNILSHIVDMNNSVENSITLNNEMLNDSKNVVKSFDALLDDIQLSVKKLETINQKMKLVTSAVNDVVKASDDIDAIAAQTNLLSLNASIEAARAGEAGRGFAVVASEISSLAAQSKESATKIKDIMKTLHSETEDAVGLVDDMSGTMDAQSKSSKESQESIKGLITKIDSSKELTNVIANSANEVQGLCDSLSDAMNALSAISEENTASTEETAASIQQMANVIREVAEMSEELIGVSNELTNSMDFFKI